MHWRKDGIACLGLAGLVVTALWRLALTDLIVGRGDLFFYFYPYRDFASAAVRAGRVPLWNPYLFMGVPFLANSQAGFFYPLNLVLAWLPVARMVNVSLALHAFIATLGGYLWGRGGLALSRPAAWLTGAAYGLGGYWLAQMEHLNQVQALAWLPWLLWAYDRRRTAVLTLIIGGQFLAGHTQSVFICLVGLGSVAWDTSRQRQSWRALLQPAGLVALAALLGGGLAAVQLLPTWELTQLSVRSGGLPYKEAVSFSLRPGLLGRALLPAWGASLFPEYVAYVGVSGLVLATVGGLSASKGRRGPLMLTGLGLFLALGGFNPFYFLLVKVVPGFGLFRAPARWLALYAVGVSGLIGVGLDALAALPNRRWRVGWAVVGGGLGLLVLGGEWLGTPDADQAWPLSWPTVAAWGVAVVLVGVAMRRRGRLALGVLLVAELWGASRYLPFNRATAPGALTDLRPAVAHLLTAAEAGESSPPARFLSISDIFFDPGDKLEIETALGPQLGDDALYDYLIATKQKEVLVPNLALYYRLPTVDGYDGGVLPLRRYVTLEQLYLPEGQVSIDGRLRENLETVPQGRWLDLFNVRFVVTDKVGDAWFDDVFYDLQMGARLSAGETATVGDEPSVEATALGVVYRAEGAVEGTSLAEFEVALEGGRTVTLTLQADEVSQGDRVARLRWSRAEVPVGVTVRGVWAGGEVWVRGLSLIDERTEAFQALVLAEGGRYRRVHSGDVKIYENLDVLPRAFFVSRAVVAADDEAALTWMREPDFDPGREVVLAARSGLDVPRGEKEGAAETRVLAYAPERVSVEVSASADGWLVLSDAWYPGWEARVDGERVPVERADVLFRAVAVPAGRHQVTWVYHPWSFRWGRGMSLVVLLGLAGGMLARRFVSHG